MEEKVMMLPPKTGESKLQQTSIPAGKTAPGLVATLLVGRSEGAGCFSFVNGHMKHTCEERKRRHSYLLAKKRLFVLLAHWRKLLKNSSSM